MAYNGARDALFSQLGLDIFSRTQTCHPIYYQRGRWQRYDYSPLYFGLLSTLGTRLLISIQAISFSNKYNAHSSPERRVISVFINKSKIANFKTIKSPLSGRHVVINDVGRHQKWTWGTITIEYLIPVVYTPDGVPVSQGYRSGIGGAGCRYSCQLHPAVIRTASVQCPSLRRRAFLIPRKEVRNKMKVRVLDRCEFCDGEVSMREARVLTALDHARCAMAAVIERSG